MIFRKYPWMEVNPIKLEKIIRKCVGDFDNELINNQKPISSELKNILKRMLVIEEEDRISWEELFSHELVNINDDEI